MFTREDYVAKEAKGTFAWEVKVFLGYSIVWFQKISRPPPRRELEIPGGWGGSEAQEIPEGRGVGP